MFRSYPQNVPASSPLNRANVKRHKSDAEVTVPRTWFKTSILEQGVLLVFFLCILRVLHIPAIAAPMASFLSIVLADKHKDYPTQELSQMNWIIHFVLVMIGREFTSTLRQPYNSHPLRSLGLVFLLGEVSGVLFMMHHSLISSQEPYAEQLAMHLLILGDYIVRMQAFATGLVVLAPAVGLYLGFPVVAALVHLDILTFKNVPGNLMSTLSLIVVLSTKSLSIVFKVPYVLASLIPALKIDTTTDEGHASTALILDILVAFMVLGLKLKDMESKAKTV